MPIASLPSLQSLDRDTLVQLAQVEAAMTVTFYAPLLPAGDAPQAGLPGWEDLLARAVAGLRRHGWETATIRRLVEPVRHWSEPGLVIKQAATPAGGNAVAAFLAAEHPPVLCRLPFSLAASMAHGRAFSLLPAMPVLQEKPRFLLLLLTLEGVVLWQCDGEEMVRRPLPRAVWPSLETYLRSAATRVSRRTPGKAAVTAASPPSPAEARLGQMTTRPEEREPARRGRSAAYVQELAAAMPPTLASTRLPLVLAADARWHPPFREACVSPYLLPDGLFVRDWTGALDELRHRAQEKVRRWQAESMLDRPERLSGPGGCETVSEDLETVLTAAWAGRVRRLQVARDAVCWGVFHRRRGILVEHSRRLGDSENLLELAARQTLLHGGEVRVVDREQMPARVVVMAGFHR